MCTWRSMRATGVVAALSALCALLLACDGNQDGAARTGKEGGAGENGLGTGAQGGFGNVGTAAMAGDGDGDGAGATGGGDGDGDAMVDGGMVDKCASSTIEPEEITVEREVEVVTEIEVPAKPVALYLMLDKSGSMDDQNCSWLEILGGNCNAPTRWSVAVDSIKSFVNDGASAGMDVALQYFPLNNGACNGAGYDTPAVPMAALPGNAGAITTSLDQNGPNGGTPTEGALRGLHAFCTQFQANNPDKRCVGVLITDGDPSGCNENVGALSDLAKAAVMQNDVWTFTVGMAGANFDTLNAIATGGGTDCDPNGANTACDASTSPTALLDALNLIRSQVTTMSTTETMTVTETQSETLECEWNVPPPPDGETLDPKKMNVEYTVPNGNSTLVLGNVDGADACDGALRGWYYDDPDDPTKILLCPDTCDEVQATPGGRVDIVVGCATIPADPS